MPDKTIKKLYYEILEKEVQLARAVAYSTRRARPFSVWEVMIPIVFILGYMRARQQGEMFVQNFIFTKKLALQAARDCCSQGLSDSQVFQRIEKKTQDLLDTLDPTLYSEAIRQAQLEEMRLLMQHYLKLLQSNQPVLTDCIRTTSPTGEDYLVFIEELRHMEKAVAAAAVETVGDKADQDMVARIDSHTHRLRVKEADRIYSQADKG